MEAIAKSKYQKGSPQKARLVIDLVRGKNVSQALAILKFTNKRAAGPIAKCLNSAIANATYKAEQDNIAIDPDDLWIKKCYVDIGPTKNRRRLRPAPQGRAYFERRHFCHITIEVTSDPMPDQEEKTYEKRGKKVMAKKSGSDTKAEKVTKKDKKTDVVKEVKVEDVEVEQEAVETVKAKTSKAETKPKKEKVVAETEETAKEETKSEEKVEAKSDDKADEKVEDTDVSNAVNPETSEEPVNEAVPENKPLAAQTDEEKTGTDEAADRQLDENEELERQ